MVSDGDFKSVRSTVDPKAQVLELPLRTSQTSRVDSFSSNEWECASLEQASSTNLEVLPSKTATYSLLNTSFSVEISRSSNSQLITIILVDRSQLPQSQELGRWSISQNAFKKDKIRTSLGVFSITLRPFFFDLVVSSSKLSIFNSSRLTIKPDVLRPGDIPVALSGLWVAHAACLYDGLSSQKTKLSEPKTRYQLLGTNIEVHISRNMTAKCITLKLMYGIQAALILALPEKRERILNIQLGSIDASVSIKSGNVSVLFEEKKLGLIKANLGGFEISDIEFHNERATAIPLILEKDWMELGVNFDQLFHS